MTSLRIPTNVEWREWGDVLHYVNHAWDPENTPHHALIGLTGSGKTYLGVNGLLKGMCADDRVLIIDTKQDDPLLMSVGKPITQLPRFPWYSNYNRRNEPHRWWYRLVVSDDPIEGRNQLISALKRIYDDGDWVLYVDEFYDLTGAESPYRHRELTGIVQKIWRKGRSRRVSGIGATQEPVGVSRILYSGSSFAWMGHIRDEERQKRLLQIGGLTRQELAIVSELKRRQWLLSADSGEFFAKTTVKL